MKRSRSSPSPTRRSPRQRTEHDSTDNVASEKVPVKSIKSIGALAGVELHPLLAGTSSTASINRLTGALTLSGSASTIAPPKVPERDNPFLAHLKDQKRKSKLDGIPHIDRHLAVEPAAHIPRPFKFNAPGKFIAKAEAERTAAQIRQLEREIADATDALGDSFDVSLISDILRSENENSTFEWWDIPYLHKDSTLAFELIGNLIQRPSLKTISASNSSNADKGTLKIYLTTEERKKLRRQRRLEVQKEYQEKVALGLIAPPPPKVKLSSLPRMLAQPGNALGDESVQDPTRIEAEIRAQSQVRAEAHQAANLNRKLTDEERALKKYRKFAEFDATETHIAAFKIDNDRLEDGGRRFKIVVNAEQNHLHGRSVSTKDFTLIVVEGGPKGIKRYTRLLLERIAPDNPSWAQLLWTGSQPAKSEKITNSPGKPFQLYKFDSDFDAQKVLNDAGYSQFWSLAKK